MRWQRFWYGEGGGQEVMRLALPLILSSSFWTLQVTIDRMFLSWLSSDAVASAMASVLLFWTPFTLLQNISNYATTFVAQYHGAERPQRVGPAVWQSLYFSLVTGIAFLGLIPFSGSLVALGEHSAVVQELEIIYFEILCYSALPTLIVASVCSFFAGRGDSWTVLLINGVGLLGNAVFDYAMIFGHWGFPAMGIAGAGWATVLGTVVSAVFGLVLLFRQKYEVEFRTRSGWAFEFDLFRRLMYYGFPNGLQYLLDCLAFTVFVLLIGRLGDIELAATSIAFTINMTGILPMLGMGQAVGILVGQRLGQNRSDLAERSTWIGFVLCWTYMAIVAFFYAATPSIFVALFKGDNDPFKWPAVAAMVTILLRFVAVYSIFDSLNMTFSFALRGAGDTRFVTIMLIGLSWPIMVLPTAAAWYYGWGIYWAWAFASAYIMALGFVFLYRFRTGIWKSMRVIEPGLSDLEPAVVPVRRDVDDLPEPQPAQIVP